MNETKACLLKALKEARRRADEHMGGTVVIAFWNERAGQIDFEVALHASFRQYVRNLGGVMLKDSRFTARLAPREADLEQVADYLLVENEDDLAWLREERRAGGQASNGQADE